VTGVIFVRIIHPFLALNAPLDSRVVAVEGWVPDHALRLIADDLNAGRLDRVYVTGIPIDHGAPLSEYATYAELGAATLTRLGAPSNRVLAVPAPSVARDRTYTCAVALKLWFEEAGQMPQTLNVATVGAHSRRSRLLFEKAFGDASRIGVMALPEHESETAAWWKYSQGVRSVVGELTGYLYAKLLFRGEEDAEERVRTAQIRQARSEP
jgi:hypothetical protein